MDELFKTLQTRRRPEDVAEMIREKIGGKLSHDEINVLDRAASRSLKRMFNQITSMMEDFHRPIPPERQVRKGLELFRRADSWSASDCSCPEKIELFIRELGRSIGKEFGLSDYKSDRLNTEKRQTAGLNLSRRRYNKLFRFLRRFERKLNTYLREQKKYEFTRVGKSGLAVHLSWEDFSSHANSAVFISYYSARCNMRSVFTNESQQRPYDEIADMLFHRMRREPSRSNWWAVAHLHPDRTVLERLTDGQKGKLLGIWLSKLQGIAELLGEVWEKSKIQRATMIVRRGNDSSTWNNTANAWNRARQSWVALLHSMGMEEELDALCFGKVLRLMAADVAAWHQRSGGDLDPDTKVWAELPLPWEVLTGQAGCTRKQIEEVCFKHGVDPIKKGWIAPPPTRRVEKFQPTPELVHGVAVSNPQVALLLRKAGWFSGQWLSDLEGAVNIAVQRDAHGFVVGVTDVKN
ncbi:hypothetical protein [Prosthecobacter sp.]|uniref:hypothetical protein n=1 Tax=Prosthecobacter sp. TaxID=1965333 RepID=UPI003782DE26